MVIDKTQLNMQYKWLRKLTEITKNRFNTETDITRHQVRANLDRIAYFYVTLIDTLWRARLVNVNLISPASDSRNLSRNVIDMADRGIDIRINSILLSVSTKPVMKTLVRWQCCTLIPSLS